MKVTSSFTILRRAPMGEYMATSNGAGDIAAADGWSRAGHIPTMLCRVKKMGMSDYLDMVNAWLPLDIHADYKVMP